MYVFTHVHVHTHVVANVNSWFVYRNSPQEYATSESIQGLFFNGQKHLLIHSVVCVMYTHMVKVIPVWRLCFFPEPVEK